MQLVHKEDRPLTELASGVDALYLSGIADPPEDLLALLSDAQAEVRDGGKPVPLTLGDAEFVVVARPFGMNYPFCLESPGGQVGIRRSGSLPAVRIQPRAAALHGMGPQRTVSFFEKAVTEAVGPLALKVARVDVFSDWHGFGLVPEMLDRFVTRATTSGLFKEGDRVNGLQFGTRKSKTISARIYDKAVESKQQGTDWWPERWGPSYVDGLSVHRVEFEYGRNALRQFQLDSPADVLSGVGDLYRYGTVDWLTLRVPTGDRTPARWPLAPE